MFRVVLTREVEKLLDRLDRPTEHRIRQRIEQLASDPFDPRLSSALTKRDGVRKSRGGGWRILLRGERGADLLAILAIDSRGQVYTRL